MKIIHTDDTLGSIHTNCLAIDWGIPKCCITDCEETIVDAIIANDRGITYGLCANHFHEYSEPGVHDTSLSMYIGTLHDEIDS